MKYKGRRQSTNFEDRRRSGKGGGIALKGGLGTIILVVILLIAGKNPLSLLSSSVETGTQSDYVETAEDAELTEFLRVVLADTEDVWNEQFRKDGAAYQAPTLVLFHQSVSSACGSATSAVGPFYCPGDDKIYIDLDFCEDLKTRLNAPGDFAVAYVLAHEVGHHIQNMLGITDQMQEMKRKVSAKEYNKLSVRLELQADFLAGVWAHHAQRTKGILDPGDLEEALRAANAIGDDRLQKQARGYSVPDSFTHGTSAQRVRWFKKGFETGDINQGDTFSAKSL